jgi:hypothetical protein
MDRRHGSATRVTTVAQSHKHGVNKTMRAIKVETTINMAKV